MAAKGTLEDLQQEVTCPLCLDTFDDPRVLACQHVYCKSCLDALAARGGNVTFASCPECRKPTSLMEGGVSRLPVAFKMNRLKQLVAKMLEEEEEKAGTGARVEADEPAKVVAMPSRQGSYSNCTRHPCQPKDVYCRHCEEVVCRDCILFDKKHANHTYDKIKIVTEEHRTAVGKRLASLLQKQPSLKKAAVDVGNTRHSIEDTCQVVSVKIGESYDRVINAVEERKNSKLKQFQSEVDGKVEELKNREATLGRLSSEVSAVQSLVERGLQKLDNVDFMARKKGMILKIDQMHARIDDLSLVKPESLLNAQVVGSESVEEVGQLCDRFLRPYQLVDPLQCTVSAGVCIEVGEATVASISLKDSEGDVCPFQQCVAVELCSDRFGEKLAAKVVMQSTSCYEARYTPNPRTRGHCQLVVRVNGCLVGSKPVAVFVECPPHALCEPVCIINDIPRPGCLKIANNNMLCRTASGICILDINNTSKPPVQSTMFPRDGKIEKWWPAEMAVDSKDEFLFVSDPLNGMVHKFTIDGRYVRSTESSKKTLNCPNGICVSGNGNLYVCDSENHCVHIFDSFLRLFRSFGTKGSALGEFCWPDNIDFDSSGQFYVTDYKNHRIQCFSSDAEPKWSVGTHGSGPGELDSPNIMQIVGSTIFVSDRSGVVVFTTRGQFVTRFATMCAASGSNDSVDGIAVDRDGFVFVSDTPNDRIIVF